MRICRNPLIALLLLLVAAVTEAAEKKFHYLQPNSIRVTRLLPAPPSVGSDEYISEIEQILALQATRTAGQIQRCKAEETLSLAAFATVMPKFCTAEKLPKLGKLLKAAEDDAKYFGEIGKSAFQRNRPFREDPRIHPLSSGDTEFAYPSGHATRGILFATILAQLEPTRSAKLLERGREVGWDRVIEGVHHPSDIAAGRVVGQAIAQALLQSPAFQADLKEVQEEYGAAKKNNAPQPVAPAVSE